MLGIPVHSGGYVLFVFEYEAFDFDLRVGAGANGKDGCAKGCIAGFIEYEWVEDFAVGEHACIVEAEEEVYFLPANIERHNAVYECAKPFAACEYAILDRGGDLLAKIVEPNELECRLIELDGTVVAFGYVACLYRPVEDAECAVFGREYVDEFFECIEWVCVGVGYLERADELTCKALAIGGSGIGYEGEEHGVGGADEGVLHFFEFFEVLRVDWGLCLCMSSCAKCEHSGRQ